MVRQVLVKSNALGLMMHKGIMLAKNGLWCRLMFFSPGKIQRVVWGLLHKGNRKERTLEMYRCD